MSDPHKPTLESVEAEGRRVGEAMGRSNAAAQAIGCLLPGQAADSHNLTAAQIARHRSGARLTEAQRAATCERSERLQVRLRPGYAARLRALSESDGYTVAEIIESWVDTEEAEQRNAIR